jgi:hypothetical protein
MKRAFVWVILGAAAAALVGCGDDGGAEGAKGADGGAEATDGGAEATDGGTEGADGDAEVQDGTVLSTLSDAQVGTVCDYVAQQYGGYGELVTCPDRETSAVWLNQDACRADLAGVLRGCAATFAQMAACTAKIAALKCDSRAAQNSAECKEFDEAC